MAEVRPGENPWSGQRKQCLLGPPGTLLGQDGAWEQLSQRSCASVVGSRCFCFSTFSLFPCLLACLSDLLLSRVADEAFYKQPFADVIGYVYVAKLIPFLFLILLLI